jgi:RNA polymerase sigma-70 factor, ECF subfamily
VSSSRAPDPAPAFRAGDESAFSAIADQYRTELRIHAYRMLGSLHDAEDAVQDTFLRAWRSRRSLKDGRSLRAWLYRIATNVSLDAIARQRRSPGRAPEYEGEETPPMGAEDREVWWLEPIPDTLLGSATSSGQGPDQQVLNRETIELAFLAAIQLLTPGQRAALILRDVLGWSAQEAAAILGTSEAAVNSALQRARATLRAELPSPGPEWRPTQDPTRAEKELLDRYIAANDAMDLEGFVELIREDAVFRMPPYPGVARGRDAMFKVWAEGGFGAESFGRVRTLPTRANLQPAVAAYNLRPGWTEYRPMAMDVLRVEEGRIAEIVTFPGSVFGAFGLPASLPLDRWSPSSDGEGARSDGNGSAEEGG